MLPNYVLAAILAGSGGGVAPDTDVTAYAAAVTTAGGTLPTTHQTALNTYIPALKASGAWALIKEMWLPLGNDSDLTTAAVKLKNGATTPTVTLTNFVSTDYTVALGIDPGASNGTKKAVTDFAPSVNGSLTSAEWGFSAYATRAATAGVLMGMSANANAWLQYFSSPGQSKIGTTVVSLQPTNNPAGEKYATKRLQTVQITGGTGYGYIGGYVQNSLAIGTPGSMPTGGMSMFALNSSFFGNAAASGYAIHAPMTPAQLRALQTFFDNVCEAIGRTVFSTNVLALGDSYVAPTPTGPSAAANDYIALYATAKGWTYTLGGTPGKGWGPPCNGGYMSGPSGGNGQTGRDTVIDGLGRQASKHVVIPMGLNDAYQTGSASAVSAEQVVIFNMIQAIGYPASYIAIGTNYWSSAVTDQTLATAIHDATVTNTAAAGFHLIDFFHGLTADPAVGGTAASLAVAQSYETGVHKIDAGHVQMKNDIINAATAGSWAGW